VLGVSWNDARAFAAWRTERAAAQGRAQEQFALPSLQQWVAASGFGAGREYAFGHRFVRRWVSGCWSRPAASPDPVMTHPVDESPYGVYDTAGSAEEWIDGWYDESRRLRLLAGGSWAQTDARLFQIFGGVGARETDANGESGFRLVLRRGAPK
jgi:formylglycine-generating enzyme required for sulfatase activity